MDELFDLRWRRVTGRYRGGQVVDADAVRSCGAAQQLERLVRIEAEALGQHTLRLLDDNPRGERLTQLCVLAFQQCQPRDGSVAWFTRRNKTDTLMIVRHGDPLNRARLIEAIDPDHPTFPFAGRRATRGRTVTGPAVYSPSERITVFPEIAYDGDRHATRQVVTPLLLPPGRLRSEAEIQATMREKFSEAVERLSGREVVGFLSDVHVDPDLSVETFILESVHGGDAVAVG